MWNSKPLGAAAGGHTLNDLYLLGAIQHGIYTEYASLAQLPILHIAKTRTEKPVTVAMRSCRKKTRVMRSICKPFLMAMRMRRATTARAAMAMMILVIWMKTKIVMWTWKGSITHRIQMS
ncbi:hypothetical protein CPB83DRAFT_151694 [Crepidotus variabilis]|uniref:Uncharacterized protein n=1 Tax=Crepidotus variabilis TaxID=179855 RepID=A0A9P6JI39_9AGAR|nr:hypothetical protein CPB83DRAFT_151694 [Crepidotus variabilis]